LVFPLIDLEGEMIGYVKILRDLTDNKRSADTIKRNLKELEDLNAHKENVLAILSHDLRSPLRLLSQRQNI
jgi:two-component system CheB/CheR fusion protein